jgi:transketolase
MKGIAVTLSWSESDARAVKMARMLAADAVQNAGNGHPGTAMALAPVAYLLFQKHLQHDPANPEWAGRDRFVLSIGHSSMTLYTQLYMSGYGLELDDIKQFRKADSLTPGHPEYGHTAGVETTTGPLGQGIANAVGIAMGLKHQAAIVNSKNYSDLFEQQVYVLAGDGCLQEGVSGEASSLAGHLALDNLILIYDDNKISIDGATGLSFTEDVSARYQSFGWNVIEVPKLQDGDVDLEKLDAALTAARRHKGSPTLIRMESTIGWPAPQLQNTAKAHGAPLGAAEIAATKELLGLDPDVNFFVDEAALAHAREVKTRGSEKSQTWQKRLAEFEANESDEFSRFSEFLEPLDSASLRDALPTFEVGSKVATRKASGKVLNALVKLSPQIWGGSADLSESNGTLIEGATSFAAADYAGLNIHFGIREHAMGAIMNGLALTNYRPYGGTFLVFSDYMRGAVRLTALMNLPVTYVWTHDSIGLGEDGPTHQPIEHLAALRLIPNLSVVRPADANETAAAWFEILNRAVPAGIALSRQDLAVVVSAEQAAEGVARGGYLLHAEADASTTLIATGSEVALALEAASVLNGSGVKTNVVSMPCVEWFKQQSDDYRESVLPSAHLQVAIEAGASAGWYEIVRDGLVIGLDHFGESADPNLLFPKYGFNVENIVRQVQQAL